MSNRRVVITFEAPDEWTPDGFNDIESVYDKINYLCMLNPTIYRILDMDDIPPEYDKYLLYLVSFINTVETPENGDRKESPFTYEQWVMCGKPDDYVQGLYFDDDQFLAMYKPDGDVYGYAKLDERMAAVIAEGIATGRFKVSPRRQEEATGNEDV